MTLMLLRGGANPTVSNGRGLNALDKAGVSTAKEFEDHLVHKIRELEVKVRIPVDDH